MATAAETARDRLDVDPAAAAQAHPHVAFEILEERRDIDAFDRPQMIDDFLGIFPVRAELREHRIIDDRPAIFAVFLEARGIEGRAE